VFRFGTIPTADRMALMREWPVWGTKGGSRGQG